ncbi:MAG: hypothetical protein FWC19_06425 [Treponema sp.]|nr:hypothetical protein [Treponema sp.]MCL2272419.1 hypothetical protein [Treponema sp.]
MKRLIFLIILFCIITAFCFAQWEFQLYGGMPMSWESNNVLGYTVTTQMTALSFGFGMVYPINERISFGVFDELIIPQSFEITADEVTTSADRSNYDNLIGMSVLLGTVINLNSNAQGNLKIPLTAGVRWMWLIASTQYAMVFGNNIGLGTGLGFEYHINDHFFIFGRAMFYYDFFAFTMTATGSASSSESGLISSFGITPNIGIGISF